MNHLLRAGSVLLLLATTACGLTTGKGTPERKRPDMNMQHGAVKADEFLQETLSDIKPALRWVHGPSSDIECSSGNNSATGSGTVTRRIDVLTIVSEQRRGSLFGVVERAWRSRGLTITRVETGKEFPAVNAATADGFQVSLAVGGRGQFEFSVTTPCSAQSSVPAPAAQPNTPPREGEYPWRPDIHDPFWSATTPPPTTPAP
ncbi:hypothetical protein ACFV98_14185 [Streptomyces violascens]|uniref:hypothetical protein n=1 Tax=Streptomyces violascens TaxID=67381 RepID=UPI003666A0FA